MRQGTPNKMHTSQFIETERKQYMLCVLHHNSNRCRTNTMARYSQLMIFSLLRSYSNSFLKNKFFIAAELLATHASYSGYHGFKSRPGDRLFWPTLSWSSSVPPGKCPVAGMNITEITNEDVNYVTIKSIFIEWYEIIKVKLSIKIVGRTFYLICKSVFWTMSIVCVSIKLQRFGSWIFFRLQVKRKDRNPCCCAPWLS
jgi:hypothetical protein